MTQDRDAMSRLQTAFGLTLLLVLARSLFPDFMNSNNILGVLWLVLIYGTVGTGVMAWMFDLNKLGNGLIILAPLAGWLGDLLISWLMRGVFQTNLFMDNTNLHSGWAGVAWNVLLLAVGTALVCVPIAGLVWAGLLGKATRGVR